MPLKSLKGPVLDVKVPCPSWYQPGFERHDKRTFKRGELVKAKGSFDTNFNYYYVFEDNRAKAHCTYTYTLLAVDAKEEIDQSGDITTPCTCEYPKDIEPCNNTEYVLYHNEEVWQKWFNRFINVIKPLDYIKVDITIDVNGANDNGKV